VKQYRNPTPAGADPKLYDEAVTTPAADIADNPYWKRDVRRAYPTLSVVDQGKVVGLLTLGNAKEASPKLLVGEEGTKQLVAVGQEGEKGLAQFFEKESGVKVLGEGGLPPRPVTVGIKREVKWEESPTSYGEEYDFLSKFGVDGVLICDQLSVSKFCVNGV
jgi:hypothetical protein